MTEAEYWEKYYNYPDITYEWNNGYLEEKAVSDYATFLTYEWFWELLKHYLRTKPIAKTVGLETGFRLTLPNNVEKVRRPDLGIVLNNNPVPLLPKNRSYKGTFDLCIEAVSDSSKADIERDDKKIEYAQGRVKEYYILDGHDRYSEFYCLGSGGIYTPLPKKALSNRQCCPVFNFGKQICTTVLPSLKCYKTKYIINLYSQIIQKPNNKLSKPSNVLSKLNNVLNDWLNNFELWALNLIINFFF